MTSSHAAPTFIVSLPAVACRYVNLIRGYFGWRSKER